MTAPVRDVIICPFCGHDVIRGSDQCDACGRELSGVVDTTPNSDPSIDSDFNTPIAAVRLSRPVTLPTTASIREAVRLVEADPAGAVVITEGANVAGIFTERDVLLRVAGKPEVLDAPVATVMTPDPVVLREDDTMATALNKMGAGGFRHIPLTRDGELVAIVTARDVLQWVLTCYFDPS